MSATESGRLSPSDERAAKNYLSNFGTPPEAPDFVLRHGPTPDLSFRNNPQISKRRSESSEQAELLQRIQAADSPIELLPEGDRQELFKDLEEMARVRRNTLTDSLDLPLG